MSNPVESTGESTEASSSPRRIVLDSFALLAYYQDEPAGPFVRDLLRQADRGEIALDMAVVNIGEVVYRTTRQYGITRATSVFQDFNRYRIAPHEVDMQLALVGAELKGRHAMSYADCIAVALAMRLDAELATGDPEFRQVAGHVRLLWLERAVRDRFESDAEPSAEPGA